MKTRILAVLTIVIGLTLAITWAVGAQGLSTPGVAHVETLLDLPHGLTRGTTIGIYTATLMIGDGVETSTHTTRIKALTTTTRYVSPDGICGGASPCYSTIQAAVNASVNGDTIMVLASTYFEHVAIGVSITIQGTGAIVNGGGGGTVITVTGGTSVAITGLTVTNGHGTDDGVGNFFGGGIVNSGTLQLIDSTVTGNSVSGATSQNGLGGGIYSSANSTLILTGSTVINNGAGGGAGGAGDPFGGPGGNAYGGGIYGGSGSTLLLVNSTINNNSVQGASTGAPIGIQGGSGYGGGIYSGISSTLTLSNTNVKNNNVTSGFGINSGSGLGGGINNNGVMTLANCTIDGNHVIGADNTGGDNGGGAYGGGIFSASTNGVVTITHSTLSNNLAQGGNSGYGTIGYGSGGGIYNVSTQLLRLSDTTISGNSTHGGAGTIQDGDGGGIYNGASSTAIIVNATLYNNRADAGGPGHGYGGAIWNGGTLTLTNSIAGGSPAGGDCFGTIQSGGYNLSSDVTCILTVTGDMTNTNPLLGLLQNNGGSTQTHALQPGSPAIDAANPAAPGSGGPACLSTDQRGVARPLDGNGDNVAICDIGAYEYSPAPMSNVVVTGPASGIVGVANFFTATVAPITATTPIIYEWEATGQSPVTNTAGLSDTVSFTWNTFGAQAITVTASNNLGALVSASHLITIVIPVIGPTGVALTGPTSGAVQAAQAFAATVTPINTTIPITYIWQASGQSPMTHTTGSNDTVSFTWATSGTQAVTVTASNGADTPVTASQAITIVPGVEVTVDPSASSTLTYTAANTSTTTVEVPAGAVTQTTTLLYTMVPTATPSSGFGFAGHAFTLEAYHDGTPLLGFAFQQPVTVTINYSGADVVGVDETTLKLDYWTGNAWVDTATTCTPGSAYIRNLTMNQLSVPICHLTQFAVFGVEQYHLYLPLVIRSP